jgi:tripartite-type tricarboxylate transporter receptor subunit TctC
MRRFRLGAAFLALTFSGAAVAQEQAWPPPQMQMVIPHDIGSSQNQTSRALGDAWGAKLNTTFVYENRTGASGRVGYEHFLGLATDCSAVISSNLESGSIMYARQKPDWDWKQRLHPLGIFTIDPGVIFIKRDSPYTTLAEVLESAKSKPVTVGVAFWDSGENLQAHEIMERTGAKFEVIPIGSTGEVTTQIIGGHIDLGFANVAVVERAGDLVKTVGVGTDTNLVPHLTDDAPAVGEVIGGKAVGFASQRGIMIHKECLEKYPERAAKLQETFAAVAEDAGYRDRMKSLGVDPGLVVAIGTEETDEIIARRWDAVERMGSILDK